jgi:two-component system sensor histidine kinase KdpD
MEIHGQMEGKPRFQFFVSILSVLGIAIICFLTVDFIGYKAVALVLLVVVSLLAILLDFLPVMMAALLSALILNYFFLSPRYTFHIRETEDLLMFLMYFLVAMVNAVLTHKIKSQEKKVRDREEKEKTIRLYNTLLNSLSHELKTPISAIIGATDTLKEQEAELSPQFKSTLLNEIETAGHRLNKQVENLLNMSRLESGMLKIKKDWCDIHELILMAIQKLDPLQRHRVKYDSGIAQPFFKVDPGLLEQVVYNILQNAIHYTPADKQVHVNVVHDDHSLTITISDQGPGFPAQDIHRIFDKFYRLPETKTGGIGLGLSIARGFTEAHGGKITVENLSTGGSQFIIHIPSETSYLNYIKNE